MKFRALLLIFAFAAAGAVGCSDDDDDDLLLQTEFKMSEIKTLASDEELPHSDDWTITDTDLSTTLGDDDYIAELLELAADNGRTINLTLANVTKIRSGFLQNVTEGLGNLIIPNATDIRYTSFFGTQIRYTLYLTAEGDFSTKYIDGDDGYQEDVDEWFDGISDSAFEYINFEDITLVLNKNKEGVEIPNLTTRGWAQILYE
ncbi:MAG: hypothetical protein R3Y68_01190 [Rikenellaceae bacterium]